MVSVAAGQAQNYFVGLARPLGAARHPGVGNLKFARLFVARLADMHASGAVEQACLLLNQNALGTGWFANIPLSGLLCGIYAEADDHANASRNPPAPIGRIGHI